MPIQSKVHDRILEETATYLHENNIYLQISTSTVTLADDADELTNGGTQIGSSSALFNLLRDTGTTASFISGRNSVSKFTLATNEPQNLPINIGSIGLMNQATAGGGLGVSGILPVTVTKDNQTRWILRHEFRIKRSNE